MVAAYEPVWKDVVDCCIILWYPLWVGSYPQLLLLKKNKVQETSYYNLSAVLTVTTISIL